MDLGGRGGSSRGSTFRARRVTGSGKKVHSRYRGDLLITETTYDGQNHLRPLRRCGRKTNLTRRARSKENKTTKDMTDESDLNITRDRMVQLLNEDLAREYQAIIAYTVYSQVIKGAAFMDIARELEEHATEELEHALLIAKQIDYLGGRPTVMPKAVRMSEQPEDLLRFDLENERETVANYRQRIRQAEAMGEFALSETLRRIIVQEQEHEIDLCDALGIDVPHEKVRERPLRQDVI